MSVCIKNESDGTTVVASTIQAGLDELTRTAEKTEGTDDLDE